MKTKNLFSSLIILQILAMSIAHLAETKNPLFPVVTPEFQLPTGAVTGYILSCSDSKGHGEWVSSGSIGGLVDSVTAGDSSILIGGSPSNPTVEATGNFTGKTVTADEVVTPELKLTTSPTAGYVLTSDASGVGSWQPSLPIATTQTWTLEGAFTTVTISIQMFKFGKLIVFNCPGFTVTQTGASLVTLLAPSADTDYLWAQAFVQPVLGVDPGTSSNDETFEIYGYPGPYFPVDNRYMLIETTSSADPNFSGTGDLTIYPFTLSYISQT